MNTSTYSSLRPFMVVCALTSMLGFAVLAHAQTETVLHAFQEESDSGLPEAALTMDRGGNLYGTAYSSGGNVFKLTRSNGGWTFNTLHSFTSSHDGKNPAAAVIFGPDGALYGTTVFGGVYNRGTVFRLAPPASFCRSVSCSWTETVLYNFGSSDTDGSFPYSSVIFDSTGNLYGTTTDGGQYGGGTVFKLSRSGSGWTESILWGFGLGLTLRSGAPEDHPHMPASGADGAFPQAGVVLDQAGNLYGTTLDGGYSSCPNEPYSGCGIVFQLTPNGSGWTENILYYFQGGADGGNPLSGLIFDPSGNAYGTTSNHGPYQGGTIFELSPSGDAWNFNVIYPLVGGTVGNLLLDAAGNLYGTTIAGGSRGIGSVFKLAYASGSYNFTTLYSFCPNGPPCYDGAEPWAGVAMDGRGYLYGTTLNGGTYQGNCSFGGCGVVFEVTP